MATDATTSAAVFTPPALAKRWACDPGTIVNLIKTGRLAGFTLSPPGRRRPRWRIALSAVIAYEEARVAQPEPRPRRRRRAQPAPGRRVYF